MRYSSNHFRPCGSLVQLRKHDFKVSWECAFLKQKTKVSRKVSQDIPILYIVFTYYKIDVIIYMNILYVYIYIYTSMNTAVLCSPRPSRPLQPLEAPGLPVTEADLIRQKPYVKMCEDVWRCVKMMRNGSRWEQAEWIRMETNRNKWNRLNRWKQMKMDEWM